MKIVRVWMVVSRVDGRWRMLVAHEGRKQMIVPSKSALKVMLHEAIRNEDF